LDENDQSREGHMMASRKERGGASCPQAGRFLLRRFLIATRDQEADWSELVLKQKGKNTSKTPRKARKHLFYLPCVEGDKARKGEPH